MFDDFFRSVVGGGVGGGNGTGSKVVNELKYSPNGNVSGADDGMWVDCSAPVTSYAPRIGQTHDPILCGHVATVQDPVSTPAPGTSVLAANSIFVCYLVKNTSIRVIQKDAGVHVLLNLPPEAGGSNIVSMSMSVMLQYSRSSFLGCITSNGHLVVWAVYMSEGQLDPRNELETEKVLFISDLGGLYGNGLLGLSWWTQSFKYSPTVLLRIRNTVVLLRMENLNLLPVEKGEGGLPFIRTGKEMKIGSTCTGAHRLDVNDASVTPDGRVLVTCGKDGRVVLWDTPFLHGTAYTAKYPVTSWPDTVGVLKTFEAHDGSPVTACFVPDTLSDGFAIMTKGLRSTRQDHGLIQFLTGGKNNRELRLWSVAPHGNVAASPAPHQTLILPHKPESSHESLLLLIFPRGEFIAASDPTQDLLYVAHLNYSSDNNVSGLAKIDYLRQRVLSMVGSLHDPMGPDFLLDKHGGHDKPWFNVGSESPQLIIHAFVKAKGVQSYTVELSDAYPSMVPHMSTEHSATEPLKTPCTGSEAHQQQRRASSPVDIQIATRNTSATADPDAMSGLISILNKDISKKDADWQKGRNSLGARLPESGYQSSTIPPGVKGTSAKRRSLHSILGGNLQTEKREVVEKGSPRSASVHLSSEDPTKKAIRPMQPRKGLQSSPSASVHAVHENVSTSPGIAAAVKASCASSPQPYNSPQETSPVKAGVYTGATITNPSSTPQNVLSKEELQDSITDSILPVIMNHLPAQSINVSSKEFQDALTNSILPVVKHVTAQTIKESLARNDVESVKSTVESAKKQGVSDAVESASISAVKEIQPEIIAKVSKLAEEGAYRGASAATTAVMPSCVQQVNQVIGTALEKTLKQSVSSAFRTDVVPSIQDAVSHMFEQVNVTLQAGFSASPLVNESASKAFENLIGIRQDINILTQQLSSLSASVDKLSQKVETLNWAQKNAEDMITTPGDPPTQTLSQINPERDLHPLLMEGKFEYAFDRAFTAQDLSAVVWICHRIDPTAAAVNLSQSVLLCLLQHLGIDLTTDVPVKLAWLHHCAICVNPNDPLIQHHSKQIIHQLKERLAQAAPGIAQLGSPTVAEHKTLMCILTSLLVA